MAIYHCSIKIISRSKGKSAVAAAAYRSGEIIKNEYDGITHDYTRKTGVVHTEILLPNHAPLEYINRTVLWNAVEKIEKAKNSQMAREIELALPVEIGRTQNIFLVHDYVQRHFVDAGMCADICVHDKGDGNPHAHIMLTMRPFEPDGSWGVKQRKEYILDANGEKIYDPKKRQYKCNSISTTDWNEQTKAEEWREGWSDAVNAVLARMNVAARVDHRSFERRGVEQIPTIHMGVSATQMERKGIVTERGDINREIIAANGLLRQLWERIKQFKDWLKEAITPPAPPTLPEIIHRAYTGGERVNRYVKIVDMQMAPKILDFLQEHNISTRSELREKVIDLNHQLNGVCDNLNGLNRRINTLDEHIRQGKTFKEHKALYDQYRQLSPKKQATFYEANRDKLAAFEYAERYILAYLNGNPQPSIPWHDERDELIAERGKVYQEYSALDKQVQDAEKYRYAAENIVRGVHRAEQKPRERGVRARELER